MLRIAIQAKGRLYEETMALLAEANIKVDASRRTLLLPARNYPVEILFLRDDDIPQSVAGGVADAGIVGQNEYAERREDVRIVQKLGFSRCRLSLAIPKDIDYPGLSWFEGKKIATSYPGILKEFLLANKIDAEIHVISGSVEVAPGIGLADAIFDIVSSGGTLVSNRLREVEVLMQSEALLICNSKLCDEKRAVLEDLVFRFNAVREAEGKKYIILNILNTKIPDVCRLLPGMKAPTVTPLAEEGWSSVHSVIEEKRFWEIIGKLKAIGAEGILVVPIEKMIL
ncbi:MAG: ATP phosphoribosyltransferase [Bacteroidales bacterium]|nr:ATP phosphoribosyltransferase [Bacteroidales bacterium]MDD4430708.1 ATP phosphoribosyltransferase [Bacteroidales bacterium]